MMSFLNISRPTDFIRLQGVSLDYDLHYDRANTLKEIVVNYFHKRSYVPKKTDKLRVLNDINFELNSGDRLGVIGLNGAGKSTLLKVISGILKPTIGSVEICGKVQPLIEIGAGLNPEFSGRENIFLNGYMLGFTKKEILRRMKEIIVFADIPDFIDVPLKYYSSGMLVRLAFSIATIIDPQILLLDEMLSAGDASFVDKAKKRMNRLVEESKIIVVVSHNMQMIEEIADRIMVLHHGRAVFWGKPAEGIRYYIEQIVHSRE